jgi:apolipoprotein N-acyltransferase
LIQIGSVTGVYGISFLIVVANASIAAAILAFSRHADVFGKKIAVAMLAGSIFLVGVTFWHGSSVLSSSQGGKDREKIRISLVQGNIEQAKKWDPKYKNYIMERYAELSREAAKERPDLIIWPEAATPGLILKNLELHRKVVNLVREGNCHFLIGSAEYPKFREPPAEFRQIGNTALFFSPEGKVLGQYIKIQLVPFAEYVPYGGVIPWPRFIVPEDMSSYEVPGREVTIFDIDEASFGVLICWESIFPGLFRKAVQKGAGFMVNITNEGWFNKPTIYHQYLAMNVFRAIENRVYLVRCANTGISCFINPQGGIERLKDTAGKEIFVMGVLSGSVVPKSKRTFYTRYGDWLPWLSILGSIVLIALALLRRRYRSNL